MNLRTARVLLLIGLAACSENVDPISTLTIPAKPLNLAITETSSGLQIIWSDQSSNEDSYKVEVSVGGGSWTLLTEMAANASSALLSAPSASTQYRFRVSACNAKGCSEAVESVITTNEVPPEQATLRISQVIKTAADAVQINVFLPSHLTGSVTLKLRRLGETAVLFTKTQEWTPNLPQTVDFYIFSLDPNRFTKQRRRS